MGNHHLVEKYLQYQIKFLHKERNHTEILVVIIIEENKVTKLWLLALEKRVSSIEHEIKILKKPLWITHS